MPYRRKAWGYDALKEFLTTGVSTDVSTQLPTDVRLFNESIGLPLLPSNDQPHALMPFQVDIIGYQGKDLIVNKSNKIGITEAILRDMAQKGTAGDCQGYDIMLGSSEERLAVENMRRLQLLFTSSEVLRQMIAEAIVTRLILKNGTRFLVMPANAAAMRSWPRVKYAFLDEAAHVGRLDDSEYFSAITSRLANTNGYLRIVSTPRGQRGMFYQLYEKARRGEIQMAWRELNYYVGLGTFFTEEYIEKEKARLGVLFEQEYMCKFITSQNAAIEAALIEQNTQDYEVERW